MLGLLTMLEGVVSRPATVPRSCQHAGVHAGLERPEIHQLGLGLSCVWHCECHDAVGLAPPECGVEHVQSPRFVQPCSWTWRHHELPRRRPFFRRRLLHHPLAPVVVGSTWTEQLPPKSSSLVACR